MQNNLKEKVISLYNDYINFDTILKETNKELQSKEKIFEKVVKGENIEENAEELMNFYKDNILKNSQLRMNFENLMFLISVYAETETDLPEDIVKFYNDYLPYKAKIMFQVEKGEISPTDLEVLEAQRKQLDNIPLIKLLKEQAS